MSEHVIRLYTNEIALHVDHNVEEFKPPFSEDALRGVGEVEQTKLTPAHIDALSVCLKSVDGIFNTFLDLDVETVRCLPVINFVRVAYAVVVLIKMYFAAVTPNSEIGRVFVKENMQVEQYLDGLCSKFHAAAAEEKSRSSHKFLMVLMMLKTWFGRQREGKPSQSTEPGLLVDTTADTPSDTQNPQQQSGQQPGYSAANTPLQLLSEVATGNSGGQPRSGSISQYAGGSANEWQQPQQPTYTNYPPLTQMPMTPYGNLNVSNVDPPGGMEFSYPMTDEAMGLAIGVGPFGEYYSDETFFGLMNPSEAGASYFEGM
jgi:hypothetical protein